VITLRATGDFGDQLTCNVETGRALVKAGLHQATGTLGVAKDVPVGFQRIHLCIDLDTDASEAERKKLLELTRRSCAVYQTLARGPEVVVTLRAKSGA